MYYRVERPKPKAGGTCKIQGRKGTHKIVEVRNRIGKIGLQIGCSARWYSELSASKGEDEVTCQKCLKV